MSSEEPKVEEGPKVEEEPKANPLSHHRMCTAEHLVVAHRGERPRGALAFQSFTQALAFTRRELMPAGHSEMWLRFVDRLERDHPSARFRSACSLVERVAWRLLSSELCVFERDMAVTETLAGSEEAEETEPAPIYEREEDVGEDVFEKVVPLPEVFGGLTVKELPRVEAWLSAAGGANNPLITEDPSHDG